MTVQRGYTYPALLVVGLLVIALVILIQSSPLGNEVQVQGVSTGK